LDTYNLILNVLFIIFRFVTYLEWPSDHSYPPYCNGWIYAVKSEHAEALAATSRQTPRHFIDDLYVTGILRLRLNLNLTQIGWTPWFDRLFNCTILNMIRVHFLEEIAYPRDEWPWQTLKNTALYLLDLA
jgi:hypothetical protein